MNLSFGDAALAALCNSERRLARRWGHAGHAVGRHLLDLSAAEAATIDQLPGARVHNDGSGEIVVAFDDEILITGIVSDATRDRQGLRADADQMMIRSVDVRGSDQR